MSVFSELARMRVAEVDRRVPVVVTESATLGDVVERLAGARRGSVLVTDSNGSLRGIFTESDLVTRIDHTDHGWRSHPVSQYMTADPETVSCGDSIGHAMSKMFSGAYRHLPVVADDGAPTSVLSIRDVLRFVAHHFPKDFVNLPPNPSLESRRPWGG